MTENNIHDTNSQGKDVTAKHNVRKQPRRTAGIAGELRRRRADEEIDFQWHPCVPGRGVWKTLVIYVFIIALMNFSRKIDISSPLNIYLDNESIGTIYQ